MNGSPASELRHVPTNRNGGRANRLRDFDGNHPGLFGLRADVASPRAGVVGVAIACYHLPSGQCSVAIAALLRNAD